MKATVYLNKGAGMFRSYEPGDLLVRGHSIEVDLSKGEDAALNRAWEVGNKVSRDDAGVSYPPTQRSMSCGDVVVIGESAWAVEPLGFRIIDGADLAASVDHGTRNPALPASW